MALLHFNNMAIEASKFSWDKDFLQGEEAKHHIGRILEFFRTTDGENYFRVQWFYRAEDTVSTESNIYFRPSNISYPDLCCFCSAHHAKVMKQEATLHGESRLFYSTIVNDNLIDCIISKVSVTQISPKVCFLQS